MKTFDGKTDRVDFLHLFRQVMMLETSNENLLCKVFPRILSGTAATWFNKLEPNSTASFEEFTDKFVTQFTYNRKENKTMANL